MAYETRRWLAELEERTEGTDGLTKALAVQVGKLTEKMAEVCQVAGVEPPTLILPEKPEGWRW